MKCFLYVKLVFEDENGSVNVFQLHSLLPFKQLHLSPDVCAECGIDVNAAAHNVFQ